jgi:hypothetical protein
VLLAISSSPSQVVADLSVRQSHGGVSPTVTTFRSPSSISRSALLSKSFLSWAMGSSLGALRLTSRALLAASRVRSRAVSRRLLMRDIDSMVTALDRDVLLNVHLSEVLGTGTHRKADNC